MVYIVAYRLKRKNARRRIAMRMDCYSEEKALSNFNLFVNMRNDPKREWELLTGDWKHITFYEGMEKG